MSRSSNWAEARAQASNGTLSTIGPDFRSGELDSNASGFTICMNGAMMRSATTV